MEYGPAPESSAPVEAWLDAHHRSFDLFIGGEWVAAEAHLDSFNPATGRSSPRFPMHRRRMSMRR